jgi:hypothetical protein
MHIIQSSIPQRLSQEMRTHILRKTTTMATGSKVNSKIINVLPRVVGFS